MGKVIEQYALKRHHQVPIKITSRNREEFLKLEKGAVDVAIEFSNPESAVENIKTCLEKGIPVVCGTTGWLSSKPEIEKLCTDKNGALIYTSNFSIGVNIFFHLNKLAAKILSQFPAYDLSMEETHHATKLDAPSGTALTLSEGALEYFTQKDSWVNHESNDLQQSSIISKRIGDEPGIHSVYYKSSVDTIELKHTANTRDGFAEGAVIAAEWLKDKKGIFGMDDVLNLLIS